MEPDLLPIGAASKLLSVSTSYLRKLTERGVLSSVRTPGGHRRYRPETLHREWAAFRSEPAGPGVRWSQTYPLAGLAEDEVWADLRTAVEGQSGAIPPRARTILGYAVTEMVNNAIDHSGGAIVVVALRVSGRKLEVEIRDDGVGAFRRMASKFGYADPADAIVDLTKGKRTTAPDRHSGEGIFFTSKAVDVLSIEANGYQVSFDNLTPDIALGVGSDAGTTVRLVLELDTPRELVDVFAAYTTAGEFDRTTPRIELVRVGGEFLSRSEAKRFAAGLEKFDRVVLDFTGVQMVGQGFVDELFRVWQADHPGVRMAVTGANPAVALMLSRVAR